MLRSGLGVLGVAVACGSSTVGQDAASPRPDEARTWQRAPDLLEPLANNAVAALELDGGCMVFSALGIDATLTGAGAHNRAYRLRDVDSSWLRLPDIPGPGRLAASAVGLRGSLFLLGGYSVAAGGAETSHDLFQRFDLTDGQWKTEARLPVPIDDAVAVAWRDRWLVVVSGWSNTANVSAVQIYDAETGAWQQATAFPGTPAFGHAGAISGDTIVVIDGAASSTGFPLVTQAFAGQLNPDKPEVIVWTDLGSHPGPARYRAAGGTDTDGRLWFHGGTATPYNFNGLRYDTGQPAQPLATTLVFDPSSAEFSELVDAKPTPTMDHRSLAGCGGSLYSVGGLVAGPAATAETWRY